MSSTLIISNLLLLPSTSALAQRCQGKTESISRLTTNDDFIDALGSDWDLRNVKQVFRYVFGCLSREVTVYPTENYYYFRFPVQGKVIWGSLCLSPQKRDKGILQFSFIEKTTALNLTNLQPVGGFGDLSEKDGVQVKKRGPLTYAVSFEGKTVVFKLNDVGLAAPQKCRLLPEEKYVGPSFDESGLRFHLLFNEDQRQFYWVLNEDGVVPETFTVIAENLVIGNRTEFVFYDDRESSRKLLVGVKASNVLQNNWYDGPFDQLPDNYIEDGRVEMKKYLVAWRPWLEGRIDHYGYYLGHEGMRVPIASYHIYTSREELIASIRSWKSAKQSQSEFCANVTRHVFKVPQE